jgi:mono/diheme cytochrome c family protein
MPRSLALLVLAAVLPFVAGAARADDDEPGRVLYLRYCGACHGPGGKGDGLAGTFIRPKPIDLTQIAKKNGGKFPFEETVRIIDGRTTVRAHGDSDMPVWGEVFRDHPAWEMTRRAGVHGTLMLITEHLRSIQEK